MSDITETNSNDEVEVYAKGTSRFKLTAVFEQSVEYKIDIPLGDKTIVEEWYVKHGILNVILVNGEHKKYCGTLSEVDYKYPRYVDVRDLDTDDEAEEGQ